MGPASLPALLTLHGLIFTGWLVAYGLQAARITVGRCDPHRTIGYWFAGLGADDLWRRSPETHRRVMLLATIDLIGPAIARIAQHSSRPLFSQHFPMWAFAGMMLFIAVSCVYDVATRRRAHPAYLWGALTLTASGPQRFWLGGTSAWLAFVEWLLRWG